MEFSISEKYASEIKIGYPITFTIDGYAIRYLMHQFMQLIQKLILKPELLYSVHCIQIKMKNSNLDVYADIYTGVIQD